jgi:hypothetical protein
MRPTLGTSAQFAAKSGGGLSGCQDVRMVADRRPSEDDPATSLLRRIGVVFLIGGFFLIQVPRSVIGVASGDPSRQLGAVVGLAFWAWLSWRLLMLLRRRESGQDARYHFTSAAGYGVFGLIYVAFEVADAFSSDFDARSVPFTLIVVGLAVASFAAGRRVERDARSDTAQPHS